MSVYLYDEANLCVLLSYNYLGIHLGEFTRKQEDICSKLSNQL